MLLSEIKDVKNLNAFDGYGIPPSKYNPEDIIKMNVPLFVRLLEYAREEIKSDADLHKVVENIINHGGNVLKMSEYENLIKI